MEGVLYLKDMSVYVLAVSVSDSVWNCVVQWNYFEKDTIGKQLTRSADSIAVNIAEAYGRFHFSDKTKFYYYARGSLYETQFWIKQANKRSLLSPVETKQLLIKLNELAKQLNGLIKGMKHAKTQQ